MQRVRSPSLVATRVTAIRHGGLGLALLLITELAAALPASATLSAWALGLLAPLGIALALALLALARFHQKLASAHRPDARIKELQQEVDALRVEQAQLRSSEEQARVDAERYRNLTSLASDWYWEQDSELRFTLCTAWLLKEDVLPQDSLLGRRRWELHGLCGSADWDGHRRVLAERRSFRCFEYQLEVGGVLRWFSVNGEPVYNDQGRFLGYRGTSRDISRRKRAEMALRASEERFHEIIGSMPVGVVVKDPHSRIMLMNEECERQWGIHLERIQGTDGRGCFTREELAQYIDTDRRAFEGRTLMETECTTRNLSTGEVLNVRVLKKPVFDNDGKPRYLIGISVDITERRRAEEQLRQSRELLRQLARHQVHAKEEERKRIARDIHDDLGQNLLALRLEVAAMAGGLPGQDSGFTRRAQLMMETVDRTIRSVRHIINDLRPAVLDLGLVAAIEWQVQEFALRSGIHCKLDIPLQERGLVLDDMHATTLFRVLQESLTNVQRHSGAGAVTVELYRDGGQAHLTVTDNGHGGACLDKGRSKQRYGLIGMQERVSMLGGKLDIGPAPDGGTRLCASLPVGPLSSSAQAP